MKTDSPTARQVKHDQHRSADRLTPTDHRSAAQQHHHHRPAPKEAPARTAEPPKRSTHRQHNQHHSQPTATATTEVDRVTPWRNTTPNTHGSTSTEAPAQHVTSPTYGQPTTSSSSTTSTAPEALQQDSISQTPYYLAT